MTLSEAEVKHHEKLRQGLLAVNALVTVLFGGAALGWGPMQLMLEDNGTFEKFCSVEDVTVRVSVAGKTACDKQTTLLMTVGLLIPLMQIFAPLLGWLVDKIGAKQFAYLQAILYIASLSIIILGAAYSSIEVVFLFGGFIVFGLCTWFQNILIVHVGLYFEGPMISRAIFILNALFDAGTLTWLCLWYIWNGANMSTEMILIAYLILAVILFGTSTYFWRVAVPASEQSHGNAESISNPSSEPDFKNEDAESPEETYKSASSVTIESTKEQEQVPEQAPEPKAYILVCDREPKEQLLSTPFILLCAFFSLNVGCNWNNVTQRDFLATLGDDEKNNMYLAIFTWIAPISILGAPLVDKLLLNFGWVAAFQTINFLAAAYQIIKISSTNLNVQVLSFLLFSFYRAFFFGISFSFLPTLIGQSAIGRAAGVLNFCLGIMGIPGLVLVPIVIERGSFLISNLFFLLLTIPSALVIHWLGKCLKLENDAKEKKKATAESDGVVKALVSDSEEEEE